MKTHYAPAAGSTSLTDEVIRDYAFHLYEQSGHTPGRDLDNWLEATACLNANIPAHRSSNRLHDHATAATSVTALAPTPQTKRA